MNNIVEKLKKCENIYFEESKILFADLMEGKHSEDSIIEILESFIKKAVKKENTRPFKIPENITLMVVDSETGKKVSFASKKTLIESFKTEKINENFDVNMKNNNRFKNNNILKFY